MSGRLKYSISRWRSCFEEKAADYSVCWRSPRAKDELYRLVVEMLEANGLRDSKRAWQLVAEVEACDCSAPEMGYERYQKFFLYPDKGDNDAFVIFRAMRV